jgi:hypothetical protein
LNADILTPFHKRILRVFSSLEESRAFYFTGAMALSAYHLRHRVSADIDIFCPEENLIPIVARKLSEAEHLIELARRKDPGVDDYYLALAFEQAGRLPDRQDGLRLTILRDIDMRRLKDFFHEQAVALLQRRLRSK